jgi:hypothetical protein
MVTNEDKLNIFISKAVAAHGDKYDYSKVEYKNSKIHVNIICTKHGVFLQRPHDHINKKNGCPRCAGNYGYTKEDFITSAVKTHGDKLFDYSKVVYVNRKTKCKIKCNIHDVYFRQSPRHHLRGTGCKLCYLNTVTSKLENSFLDCFNITERQVKLNGYIVDGYDSKTNTVYEFLGDYWHGNPTRYNYTDINKSTGDTFGILYQKTIDRLNSLKQMNYNIIYIWECDYNKYKKHKISDSNILLNEYCKTL